MRAGRFGRYAGGSSDERAVARASFGCSQREAHACARHHDVGHSGGVHLPEHDDHGAADHHGGVRRRRDATTSGLTILPGALLLGFLNPVTGRYLDRHGALPLIVVGGVVTVTGTLAFCVIDPAVPEWVVTVLYGIRVAGISCLMMPMQAYGTAALSHDELSQATAILTSFRQVFGSVMSSVLISVMAAASGNAIGIDAHGFAVSFAAQATIVLAGTVAGAVYAWCTRKA